MTGAAASVELVGGAQEPMVQKKPERHDRIRKEKDRGGEFRNHYQRDRDRILHSSALRRLAGVTQVVGASEEGHLLHNRLTHSLKVAQIARRIAERLTSDSEGREKANVVGGVDPDVAEAAALAHDLGHPPFGHIAEVELDEAAKRCGLSDAFEGNAQTFRIVTRLAIRDPRYKGLNLTRATLNAILKYPWTRSTDGTKREKKWSVFDTEADEFIFARQMEKPGDTRKSAEAELMDWADDIAYSVHDVEDFYRVGLIPLDRLGKRGTTDADSRELNRFLEGAFARRKTEGLEYKAKYTRDELRLAFDRVREFFIGRPYSSTDTDRGDLRVFTSKMISHYVSAISLDTRAAVDPTASRVAIARSPEQEVTMLKELTWFYVINNPALATQQYGQRHVIRTLFEIFEKAATDDNLNMFPTPSRELLERIERQRTMHKSQKQRNRLRVVVDLLAGLTEQQALSMYQRVQAIAPGSALVRLYL